MRKFLMILTLATTWMAATGVSSTILPPHCFPVNCVVR